MMKPIIKTLAASAVVLGAMAGNTQAADKELIFSHWAGPKHVMATGVAPWLNDQLSECSGGS